MKKYLYLSICLLFNVLSVVAQCPIETEIDLGGLVLEHSYYESSANSVYSYGYFQSSVNINGLDYFPSGNNGFGQVIIESDTLGNVITSWQPSFPTDILIGDGTTGNYSPNMIVSGGSVTHASTFFDAAAGNYKYYVQNFLSGGSPNWEFTMDASATTSARFGIDAINQDFEGQLIVAGVIFGEATTQGEIVSTLGIAGKTTAFVLSFDTFNGSANWFATIEGSENMEISSLETDSAGGIYVAGNSLGATSLIIDGAQTDYVNDSSAFAFKIQVLDNAAGTYNVDWVKIFDNPYETELPIFQYDQQRDILHYSAVSNTNLNDDAAIDAQIGALNPADGSDRWGPNNLQVDGWHYPISAAWLDPVEDAIYYVANSKSSEQRFSTLSMNGSIIQDTITSFATIQKVNASTGENILVSPNFYGIHGDVATIFTGNVFAQNNNGTNLSNTFSTAKLIPDTYPYFFHLLINRGGSTVGNALLEAYNNDTGATVSYQWMGNGNDIPGETSKTFVPTAPGIYSVRFTDQNGCLVMSDPVEIFEAGGNSQSDSLALRKLYQATNGDNWTNNSAWLDGTLDTWFGVTVDGAGRVVSLDLSTNNLVGTLPIELGDISFLGNLNLAFNSLTGGIPKEIENLTNLNTLSIEENPFGGTLTIDFNRLPSLQFLILRNCQLEGALPPSIGALTVLREISIESNNFSGNAPNLFGIASLQAIAVGNNPDLFLQLPADLSTFTNLRTLSMWNTQPNGGEFPVGVYQLTNLLALDLSNQDFTGSLSPAIGNLTNLQALYVRGNKLSGSLPAELASLTNLNTLDLSGNDFFALPAGLVDLPNLIDLSLGGNKFQIFELLPFTTKPGLSGFGYSPQGRVGTNQITSPSYGASFQIGTEIEDVPGMLYQWYFNNQPFTGETAPIVSISNFVPAKAGGFVLEATHPDLPELILRSAFINVLANTSIDRWYVDNNAGHTADFRDLYQAVSATKEGDTIYVAGSDQPYGSFYLFSPRVLIGPGYFLNENAGTQFNKVSAKVPNMYLSNSTNSGGSANSSGSRIYGMEIGLLELQQWLGPNDTLSNVLIEGVKADSIFLKGNLKDVSISKSYVDKVQYLGAEGGYAFAYGAFKQNLSLSNNIIGDVEVYPGSFNFTDELTNASQVVWDRNTIQAIGPNISNSNFTNSLVELDLSTGNTFTGSTLGSFVSVLQNGSGTFLVDSDFTPITALNVGAFSGASPYELSGLPPVPVISNLTIGATLSVLINASNVDGVAIQRARYVYRQNNTNSNVFNLSGFTPSADLAVEFLPNRSEVLPNQIYDLVVVVIDANGKRSHRNYLSYETITASLTGNIIDKSAVAVNNTEVKLFAINKYAGRYDTAAVQLLQNTNAYSFNNLILGEYIILADPDTISHPDLLPTYLGNTIDWQMADTLQLTANQANVDVTVENRPTNTTLGGSTISGIMYEDFEESDSSLRVLPRRKVKGASVSARVRSGSARENNSLRVLNNDELVALVKTNEEGEFLIKNLQGGTYVINCDYPGIPVDQNSDIEFELSGNPSQVVKVEAVAADGLIVVSLLGYELSNDKQKEFSMKLYPNPTSHYLNFKIEAKGEELQMKLYGTNGQLLEEGKINGSDYSLDVSALNAGMYLLHISDERGNFYKAKFLKK